MINEKLKLSYKNIFDSFDFTELQKYQNLSNVFLAKSDQLDKLKKIMIIGQETRGWFKSFSDEPNKDVLYIENRMNYDRFGISKGTPKSAFLNFLKKVEKRLEKYKNIEVIWANLFCISSAKKSPKKHPEFDKIKQLSKHLLTQQVNIINPSAILFVTGPSNDKYIRDFFEVTEGNLSVFQIPGRLWHFKINNIPCFRVTHPRFWAGKTSREQALLYIDEYLETCND